MLEVVLMCMCIPAVCWATVVTAGIVWETWRWSGVRLEDAELVDLDEAPH